MIRKVLDPIWTTKNETASRVRQRIEAVLAWATVSEYRRGDNPARWKNHLDLLLAPPTKVKKPENHPALHYSRLGGFIGRNITLPIDLVPLYAGTKPQSQRSWYCPWCSTLPAWRVGAR